MGEVVNLIEADGPVCGANATADIVNFLREYATALETGEKRPVQKIVIVGYEDRADQFRVTISFLNTTPVERAGMLSIALHDTVRT